MLENIFTIDNLKEYCELKHKGQVEESLFQKTMKNQSLYDFSIENITFGECVFIGVDFENVDMNRTNFINCIFENCSFKECKGLLNFSQSKIKNTQFYQCAICDSDFSNCDFHEVHMTSCDLSNIKVMNANYEVLDIKKCRLSGTPIEARSKAREESREYISDMVLSLVGHIKRMLEDMIETFPDDQALAGSVVCLNTFLSSHVMQSKKGLKQIDGQELRHILNQHAQKMDAPIFDNDVPQLKLEGYDLQGFDFDQMNLSNISFKGSDLTHANLAGCNCTNCDFTNVIFKGAFLFQVKLYRCWFKDADMTDVVLDKENRKVLQRAGILEDREMDDFDEI